MIIKSPITGSNNTSLENKIPTETIVQGYKKSLEIDVVRFFKGISSVNIHKCLDTGYKFYEPSSIAGDDIFYQEIEKFPWYYMDAKWEHDMAKEYIKNTDKILEIGCAKGSFMETEKSRGVDTEGLEMNSSAVKACKDKGLIVYNQSIENFSKNNHDKYDVVCSFQVVEHVHNIKDFIEASLITLKTGGKMIICVPNNDSMIFQSNSVFLNMPPHHMGIWNMNSFIKLQDYFNMTLEAIHFEPLQKYHLGFLRKIVQKAVSDKIRSKMGVFANIIMSFAKRFALTGSIPLSNYIMGHSILVVFRKK